MNDGGKTILVCGASSDVGVAFIKDSINEYKTVLAHYNHMNSELNDLIETFQGKIIPIQADLSRRTGAEELIEKIRETGETPEEILHLPALPFEIRKFHKISWEEVFEKEINISLKSAIKICQAYLPIMSKRHYGKIVIMLSMVVNGMPPKYNSDYVVIKHALYGMVKALAVEYAEKGVCVNGISPALIQTKFINNMHPYLVEQNAQMSPTGSNLKVEDVVPTIRFLLSSAANTINGQNILITNGR